MKKIISVLLSACMLSALFGCGREAAAPGTEALPASSEATQVSAGIQETAGSQVSAGAQVTADTQAPIEASAPTATEPSAEPTAAEKEKAQSSGSPSGKVRSCTQHQYALVNVTVEKAHVFFNDVCSNYKCTVCGKLYGVTGKALNDIESVAPAEINHVVKRVNELRKSQGLSRLDTIPYWTDYAATRAEELTEYYGHGRPNGDMWISANNGLYTVAENIGCGCTDGEDFFQGFCDSPQHYGAMLTDEAVAIGVGFAVNSKGCSYCAMVLLAELDN